MRKPHTPQGILVTYTPSGPSFRGYCNKCSWKAHKNETNIPDAAVHCRAHASADHK